MEKALSQTPTYKAWRGIMNRCYTKTNKDYSSCGGKGIKVYPKWQTFEGFFQDMGEKPENSILMRKDLNKDFTPDNTFWKEKVDSRNNDMYTIWRSMKNRSNPNNSHHKGNYKKNNITICKEWKESFEQFVKDMGQRPSKNHSIDRIDNLKGYSPENCRWATVKQQQNNREANVILEYRGKRQTIAQWADELEVSWTVFKNRLDKVFSSPVEKRKQKVRQLTKEGKLVAIHKSVTEASKNTGIGNAAIRKCLCGHNNTSGGYKWEYVIG